MRSGKNWKSNIPPIISAVGLAIVFLLSCLTAFAETQWWQKSEGGWFFYKEHPIQKEEPQRKTGNATAGQQSSTLFSEQQQQKGKELLSEAIERPTVDNVQNYIEYNKEMYDRSTNFSAMWQRVSMCALSWLMTYHPPTPTRIYIFRLSRPGNGQHSGHISKAGHFFIYSSTCPYCKRQAVYLRKFLDEYPFFTVKAVTIDGTALPQFPDSSINNGIAERLGVARVPAVFLAEPPDKYERVSTGIVTDAELKQRLLWYNESQSLQGDVQMTNLTKGEGADENN